MNLIYILQVYLGYDITNKRYIAIKQVKIFSNDHARKVINELSFRFLEQLLSNGLIVITDYQEVEALKAEIELLRKLRHDRIVSYYGAEFSELELSILMEYMPGVSKLFLIQIVVL